MACKTRLLHFERRLVHLQFCRIFARVGLKLLLQPRVVRKMFDFVLLQVFGVEWLEMSTRAGGGRKEIKEATDKSK